MHSPPPGVEVLLFAEPPDPVIVMLADAETGPDPDAEAAALDDVPSSVVLTLAQLISLSLTSHSQSSALSSGSHGSKAVPSS